MLDYTPFTVHNASVKSVTPLKVGLMGPRATLHVEGDRLEGKPTRSQVLHAHSHSHPRGPALASFDI